MYDGIKLFLTGVGYFFIAYLIGYSTFLFSSARSTCINATGRKS